MREQKSPQEDRPTAEGHRLGVPVPWLWVCLSPGDSLVYCTRYLSISWRHAARFLAGAVLNACTTPWQAASCEAPPRSSIRVRPASPACRRLRAACAWRARSRPRVDDRAQPVPSLCIGRRRKKRDEWDDTDGPTRTSTKQHIRAPCKRLGHVLGRGLSCRSVVGCLGGGGEVTHLKQVVHHISNDIAI